MNVQGGGAIARHCGAFILLSVAAMQGAKLIAMSIMSAAGCAAGTTAVIEQTWRAPELRGGQLTHVVTRFSGNGVAITRSVEDRLAQALDRQGLVAVPAYAVLSAEHQRDRVAAADALRIAGFDGIITMRVIDQANRFAWGGAFDKVIPETVIRIETDVYSLRAGRVVWAARARATEPSSVQQLIDDVTDVVSAELVTQDVVRPLRRVRFRGKQ